ncbi:MAG: hypothetical protein V1913_14375 [Fibrobacterota bacterium]
MRLFIIRLRRAALLDASLYREVRADPGALSQAVLAVALSSLALGAGVSGEKGAAGFGLGILSALVSWFLWAVLTYAIGTRLLPVAGPKVTVRELLRALGFSASPGLLNFIGLIPYMSAFIFCVTQIWMLVAMIAAIRAVFDYPGYARAAGVCVIGWVLQSGLQILVLSILDAVR